MASLDLEEFEQIMADLGERCESLVYRDGVGTLTTRHGIIRDDGSDDIPGDAPIRALVDQAKETLRARNHPRTARPPQNRAAQPRGAKRSQPRSKTG